MSPQRAITLGEDSLREQAPSVGYFIFAHSYNTAMYEFQGIDFGPTEVTVEGDTLRGALDQMGQLYNLHKDALFLAAHVEFFHDVEPEVVPRSRDDDEGYQYRGFECLRTGCNITFKETEDDDGLYPGRYRAYRNGDDNPKLYDPKYEPEKILQMVDTDTPFVRRFGVDIGANGQHHQGPPSRGQKPDRSQSSSNPSGTAEASSTRQNGHESEKMYDTSSQSAPTPEPAANQLLEKVQGHSDDTFVRDVEVGSTTLTQKLVGLAEYLGHGNGYLSRVREAVGVTDLGEVPMGQIREVVLMIVDEDTLEENEQLQPDDDLPF